MELTKNQYRLLSDITADLFKVVVINTIYITGLDREMSNFVKVSQIIASLSLAIFLLYSSLYYRKVSRE
jgi:hypothetical protein